MPGPSDSSATASVLSGVHPRLVWQALVGSFNNLHQFRQVFAADRTHQPKLGHVAADGVGELGPLLYQYLADLVQHHHTLLVWALHLDEPHRRPGHRLADRLRVGRIILLAFDIGFTQLGGISRTS